MNIITKLGVLLALAMTTQALPEAANLDAAKTQAAQEKRDIMVDFTGTDWCTACIHLRTKIIDSAAFKKAYGEKFVLVSVDFPRTPELVARIPDEEKQRRENLLTAYRIEGLPGVVLMDEKGMPYEIIQGARRTTAEYLPLVEAGLQKRAARDAAFAKAAALSGPEKAKALAEGLMILPEVCRDKYVTEIDFINSVDTENKLGFKGLGSETAALIKQTQDFRNLMASFRGKLDSATLRDSIDKLNEFLAQPNLHPEIRQQALSSIGDSYALLGDYIKMYEHYKKALETAPNSRAAKRIRGNVENFEQNVLPNLK